MLYLMNQFICSTNMLDRSARRDGITLDGSSLSLKNLNSIFLRHFRLIMLLNNGDTVFTSFLMTKQVISERFHLIVVLT
jgi:hypothetical protein